MAAGTEKNHFSLEDIKLGSDVIDNGVTEIPDGSSPVELLTSSNNNEESEKKRLEQDIEDRKADRNLRDKFGDKAYSVVRKTLYGWAVLLVVYAFCKLFFGKELFSDKVLIAITTAVTLNTFAAFLGVIRGLFPSIKIINKSDK
ncbi:hypothetical protein AB6F62_20330 [Providencia huaxiensis]|uniref:hypothetical protein n=1 Tax=Providencia huaxiensis TaxID=2027290 RepID=UPI0034DD0028